MKTYILSNMNSVKNSFAKRVLMVIAVVMTASSVWGLTSSDISSTAATSITDGGLYVVGTSSSANLLNGEWHNSAWGYCTNTLSEAIVFTAHGSTSGFYLTSAKCGTIVAATSNFTIYNNGTTANLSLGGSGQIQNKASSSYILRYNNTGARWYNSSTGSVMYLYPVTLSACTVTYNAGSGTCKTSDTESSGGSGITLATATPSDACATEGWVFAGWKRTRAQTETTSIPTMYAAGSKYYPTANETLYAVYRLGTVYSIDFESALNSYSDWSFNQISSQQTTIHTHSGSYHGVTSGGSVTITTAEKIASPKDIHFYISKTTGNTTSSTWKVQTSEDGSTWDDRTSQEATSMYAPTWVEVSQDLSSYTNVYVRISYGTSTAVRAIDDVTLSCATYNSNPSCCDKLVELSKGTQTNVSSIAFSSDDVATCSSTAADRQVTVTVTTNTGYKMVGDLGFAKTGTVTATKKSGPTGTGPYTYVYEFDQNDNGTGTFSATATAKTYTIDLNGNEGTGHTSSVTATYNSSSLSSSFTNPQRAGYTFDGWYSGSGGTGTLIISTSGVLQANVSTYTGAGGIWIKDDGTTLYAKWTPKNYKLTVGTPNNVAISATPDGKSEITEGNSDAAVPCGTTIALSAVVDDGYSQAGWKITKDEDESDVTEDYPVVDGEMSMPPFDATVTATMYSDFVFSCAELTLTPVLATAGTPIFITSTASKTVRSQDKIEITGSGLTPNTELTFPGLPSKFEILTATGGALATNSSGVIEEDAYIFYTPGSGDTSDGLDKITGITVSVDGAKPITKKLTQDIIGRHLPAEFVIAGKKDNKWYALPSNMASTGTPAPSEIAVNDINNPSIAYTAASNIYGLAGSTASNISGGNGQYVRLTMSIDDGNDPAGPAPLFGTSGSEDVSSSPKIGKSGYAKATSDLSAGWWWLLTQTNTSVTNPQDAKYTIKCANNNHTLSIKNSPFVWGLYASGVSELRLIPASDIPYTEAYFVEWGQHGGVIEVDAANAGGSGQAATSVVAHLGEASSSAIELSQTKTSVKGSATKYNYTVNFGDRIDFADPSSNGALLTLEWKNGATTKAMTSLIVPKIIAVDGVMSEIASGDAAWSSAEVHVLPGVTLEADAYGFGGDHAVTIKQLEIYPDATVKVTTGTLNVASLVLRNGWTRAGSKKYGVARLYITQPDAEAEPAVEGASLTKANITDGWYTDWYIDFDQYYPIAVPWPVATGGITYRYTSVATSDGLKIRYYNGAGRAETGQKELGQNWVEYTWSGTMPANLEPSKGYAISARRPTGKAFSIIRMPMTFTNPWGALGEQGEVSGTHKDQVTVTAYGQGTAEWYAMGWNFIGNPYMSVFNDPEDEGISGSLAGQNGGSIRYATIPTEDFKNYYQVNIKDAGLKPASGFFVQGTDPDGEVITFNNSNIVVPSAPVRYTATKEVIPEQEAYIRMSYQDGKDQMGLIIGEDYTENYEVNADLAKVLGDGNFVNTYMQYGGMDMAYVAINKMLAQEWIPVTVKLPIEGEYTYSLTRSSEVAQLEGVYLIDYQNNNQVTNLIMDSYTFTSESGTFSNRFAINAIVGERQTPTDIDAINAGADINSDKPFKFVWREKVYILHRGVIYDATGKKVR